MTSVDLELWSFHYHPEPTGIGPVSRVLAAELSDRGHEVSVVAAHPHYPRPMWGSRWLPHREDHDGVPVLRLPLWIGRQTALERYRQEVSFVGAHLMALPYLGRQDVVISVSPSFPGLVPALLNRRVRRVPWVIWLQDILPDGATATGIVDESSAVVRASRRLELAAYRNADRIIVISEVFRENLLAKGVPEEKIELIYNPATRVPRSERERPPAGRRPRVLSMGNIGHSQGLAPLVAAFERSEQVRELGAELVITGSGVASDDVAAQVRSERVQMPGVVDDDRLEHELQAADLALVSQRYGGAEFNFPSKLMNFMTYGLPVLAAVHPGSEVARVVERSGAGWVVDSSDPDLFPAKLAVVLQEPEQLRERGAAARRFAAENFSPQAFAGSFERTLAELLAESRQPARV